MATSVTLHWQAAPTADVDTNYNIYLDDVAAGQYRLVANVDAAAQPGAPGTYTPAETTLQGALARSSDPTIVYLPTGTEDSFPANTSIVVDREVILLGALTTGAQNVYTGCLRGQGATLPEAHENGAVVYGAHQTHTINSLNFGDRHVIRARIEREQGSDLGDVFEGPIVRPSAPPDAAHTTMWGIIQDQQNNPQLGVDCILQLEEAGLYLGGSGEFIFPEPESTKTDADGYFEFFIPRSIAVSGNGTSTLTVRRGVDFARPISKKIVTVPNKRAVHFRECLEI